MYTSASAVLAASTLARFTPIGRLKSLTKVPAGLTSKIMSSRSSPSQII